MTSKQLSVATRTRDFTKKSSQIRRCLQGYPEGLYPKQIALKTRLNVNTVKSTLPKMRDIENPLRGLYKVLNKGDSPPLVFDLFDWNFHNLILSVSDPIHDFKHDHVFDFGLVRVRVMVGVDKVSFHLSCDYPLNVSSICMVAGWVMEVTQCSMSDITVSTIEFNKDFKSLRLDGVNSISVDSLVEQFKVYQKKVGLRVEHKTKVPLQVVDIVDMLSNNPNSLEFNVKLNAMRDRLERLTAATNTTTGLLLKIVDKLNGEK